MKVDEQLVIYNHESSDKIVNISNNAKRTEAYIVNIKSFGDLVNIFKTFSKFGINWNRDGVYYESHRGFKSNFVFMDYDNLTKDGYEKIHKYYDKNKDICYVEDSSSCDVSNGKYKLHLFHWVDNCVIWKNCIDPMVWENVNPYKNVHKKIFGVYPKWDDKKNNPNYRSKSEDAYDLCIETNLFNKCFNRIRDISLTDTYKMRKYIRNNNKYTYYKYSSDTFRAIFKDFNIGEKLFTIPCRNDLKIVLKEVTDKWNREVSIPDYFTDDINEYLKDKGTLNGYYKKITTLRKYTQNLTNGRCFPNNIKKLLNNIKYYEVMPRMPMMRHCVLRSYSTSNGTIKKFFVDSGHRKAFCDHYIYCATIMLYFSKKYDKTIDWNYESIINALMCDNSYIDIYEKDKFFIEYDVVEKVVHRYFDIIANEELYIKHIKTHQCKNIKYKPHLKNWNVEKPWCGKIMELSNKLKAEKKRINIVQLQEYWNNVGLDKECPFTQFYNSLRSFLNTNITKDDWYIIADFQSWLMIGKNCPHNAGMKYNTISKKMDCSLDLIKAYNNGIISERTFKRRKKELGVQNVLLRSLANPRKVFVEETGKTIVVKKEAVMLNKDKVRNVSNTPTKKKNVKKSLPKVVVDVSNL